MSSKEIQDQFTQKVFLQLKSGSWELSLFPKVMRYLKYLRTSLGHKTAHQNVSQSNYTKTKPQKQCVRILAVSCKFLLDIVGLLGK